VKYLSFFLLAGLCTLTACQNINKKNSPPEEILKAAAKDPGANAGANKFNIDAPAGWQKIDTSINGITFTFLLAPTADNAFRANINVISQSMSDSSPESYFDRNISSMGQYLQNFSPGTQGEKQINGQRAKLMHYSHTQGGHDLDGVFYIIPKDGIAYVITFTVAKGLLSKYQAPLEEALRSFRIN